jgi:hypothetical protein
MYSLNLLVIALEPAREDPSYGDVACKVWEHFLYIANAIHHLGNDGVGMWDERDGCLYDVLHTPSGDPVPLKIRSMDGSIPLYAIETLKSDTAVHARRERVPFARHPDDPHWHDLILYDEYFNGDDGSGVGASHQTGWTGLVAELLQHSGEATTQTTEEIEYAALGETLSEVPA